MGTYTKAGPFRNKTILFGAIEKDHSHESILIVFIRGQLSLFRTGIETSLAVCLTGSEHYFFEIQMVHPRRLMTKMI